MLKEIGSEFWMENIPNESKNELPKWLSKFGDAVLTSSGRGAISLLLHEVQPKFKTALFPAYTCDSVILPFVEQGYKCYFYDINEKLEPDLKSIVACGDIGIFIHMGYYGFPTNTGLLKVLKDLKSKSTIIVEDITHTLFSDYERFEENDYYIASIRKWIGLPSGGFLASPRRIIKSMPQNNEFLADTRREALLIKAHYIADADETLKAQYLDLFAKGEDFLDKNLEPYHIDNLSKSIIGVLKINEIREKRADNFITLSKGLKNVEYIESVFSRLPENVCPLFYPIYINKTRSEVRQHLIEQKIYCPIHWPIPEQIDCSHFEKATKIYNKVLSIPCDQRYGEEDMNRVISALRGL
jgi:dTDP-4-amino-4,6-dideoxygalactose transaminase